MYNYTQLIESCREREREEKARGIEIGPIVLSRLEKRLERNFFSKFQELGWSFSKRLKSVGCQSEFDSFHHSFVQSFRQEIRGRSGTQISYGEAQKPVNIFLKEYVEKSGLLDKSRVELLSPLLHVTLDGVMILYLESFFRDDYQSFIAPVDAACGHIETEKLTSFHKKDISESHLTQLMFFNYEVYAAWQAWFRRIFPERPVLLDAVWSIARNTLLAP